MTKHALGNLLKKDLLGEVIRLDTRIEILLLLITVVCAVAYQLPGVRYALGLRKFRPQRSVVLRGHHMHDFTDLLELHAFVRVNRSCCMMCEDTRNQSGCGVCTARAGVNAVRTPPHMHAILGRC